MFKTKRLLSLLLAIVMIASLAVTSMVSVSATAWDGTTTTAPAGKGTAEEPYLIASAENLAWLSATVASETFYNSNKPAEGTLAAYTSRKVFEGVYFKQTADIDLGGMAFTPIGTYMNLDTYTWKPNKADADDADGITVTVNYTNRIGFAGIYDGGDFKISNATVAPSIAPYTFQVSYEQKETEDKNGDGITVYTYGPDDLTTTGNVAGLFGLITGGAIVKNINAVNIDVNGATAKQAGIIVGYAVAATVENCTTDATSSVANAIAADGNYVGGIIGCANDATVVNGCTNNAPVNNTSASVYSGGIAGNADAAATVKNCKNTATITNTARRAGGIVGSLFGTVDNCVNTGNVVGGIAGGVVGTLRGASALASNSTNSGAISGNNVLGGIVGYVTDGDGSEIQNCVNNGTVTGNQNIGGIVGQANSKTTITGCVNNNKVTATGTAKVFVGGIAGSYMGGTISYCVNNGAVTGSHDTAGIAGRLNGGTVTYCINNAAIAVNGVDKDDTLTIRWNAGLGGIVGQIAGADQTISYCVNKGSLALTYTNNNGRNYRFGGLGGILGLDAHNSAES